MLYEFNPTLNLSQYYKDLDEFFTTVLIMFNILIDQGTCIRACPLCTPDVFAIVIMLVLWMCWNQENGKV